MTPLNMILGFCLVTSILFVLAKMIQATLLRDYKSKWYLAGIVYAIFMGIAYWSKVLIPS